MSLTLTFIIVAIVVIAAYDWWVIEAKGKYESISAYVIRMSRSMPLVVLLIGIVLGHLFWSMNTFDWADKEYLIKRCSEITTTK